MVQNSPSTAAGRAQPAFAAIDLGTNNCRLLIAVPHAGRFKVIDSFSRIVRLGEGLGRNGVLSDAAMERTLAALRICADKMEARAVFASRQIATQACRAAGNGLAFLDQVKAETGLDFDLITPAEEASLSVTGCLDLAEAAARAIMVFDIGGGSTEVSWLYRDGEAGFETVAWTSLPIGVVTLAERHGGPVLPEAVYQEFKREVAQAIGTVEIPDAVRAAFASGAGHMIGTSGTVTSLAGVHLGLTSYSRQAVDGAWLLAEEIADLRERLDAMGPEGRGTQPCIGPDRADLVIPGCAILEGIIEAWPTKRIRVGDRGLREGLLMGLMERWRDSGAG